MSLLVLCCWMEMFYDVLSTCMSLLRYGSPEHECSTLPRWTDHHSHLHYHDALHSKGRGKHSGNSYYCGTTILFLVTLLFCVESVDPQHVDHHTSLHLLGFTIGVLSAQGSSKRFLFCSNFFHPLSFSPL